MRNVLIQPWNITDSASQPCGVYVAGERLSRLSEARPNVRPNVHPNVHRGLKLDSGDDNVMIGAAYCRL